MRARLSGGSSLEDSNELPALMRAVARPMRHRFYQQRGKRALDVLLSVLIGLVCWPVLLISTVLVRLTLGSPILFRQTRPGLHGEPFVLFKLRTMTEQRDESGWPGPDAPRLRSLGLLLRRTSIDELPQLFNALKGDMSLVGPRPLLMEYLDRYTPEQARRHTVLPGITGLAQTSGRNAISWNEKFALDLEYVDNVSLLLDLKILARTAFRVVTQQGINEAGHATTREFIGVPHASRQAIENREC